MPVRYGQDDRSGEHAVRPVASLGVAPVMLLVVLCATTDGGGAAIAGPHEDEAFHGHKGRFHTDSKTKMAFACLQKKTLTCRTSLYSHTASVMEKQEKLFFKKLFLGKK